MTRRLRVGRRSDPERSRAVSRARRGHITLRWRKAGKMSSHTHRRYHRREELLAPAGVR
jgi:hypothetical protein